MTTQLPGDAAAEALLAILDGTALLPPGARKLLWRNARDGAALQRAGHAGWVLEQTFKPFADALLRHGFEVRAPHADERFDVIAITPPRQRDAARALYADALPRLVPGGRLVVAVANNQGAGAAASDLTALLGPLESASRRKCRVLWTTPRDVDATLAAHWRAEDEVQHIADGAWWSRPGLFAWDHVDDASALLAAYLPEDLAGRAADLGAGFGFLAATLLTRCRAITSVDLYEADQRALEPAERNLARAVAQRGSGSFAVHWHDVTQGIDAHYDVIAMNPPFHVDRREWPELGQAFIERAADALLPHGRLLLVANRQLPYEATLAARFASVRVLAEDVGFKALEAAGPRAR